MIYLTSSLPIRLVNCKIRREAGCGGQAIRGEGSLQTTFGDLDGQLLQFPPDVMLRPSKWLLGLHAVAAWLEAGRNYRRF
jgi:hypothetical protein